MALFENHSLVKRAAEQSFRRFLWLVLLAGILVGVGRSQTPKREHVSWADYLGGSDSAQYSALTQSIKRTSRICNSRCSCRPGGIILNLVSIPLRSATSCTYSARMMQ